MIDIFKAFSSSDRSLCYLQAIFGNMTMSANGTNVIPTPKNGCEDVVTTLPIVLGEMFRTFNSIILAVGALIVVYVTVMGVLATAHEGEFMGKKWGGHSLWLPIRTVIGIAALVPSASGYSFIQIVMMWIVVQGVGAADKLWDTTIQAKIFGVTTATPIVTTVGVRQNLTALFQSLVCDATLRQNPPFSLTAASYESAKLSVETKKKQGGTNQGNKSDSDLIAEEMGGLYFCSISAGAVSKGLFPFCKNNLQADDVIREDSSAYAFGPFGMCGTIKYCNTKQICDKKKDSLGCATCQAQNTELQKVVKELIADAEDFASKDLSYRQFYVSSYMASDSSWDWIYNTYCRPNDIAKGSCCISSSSPVAQLQTCQNNNNAIFPSPDEEGPPPEALQNAGIGAVTQLYAPSLKLGDFIGKLSDEYSAVLQKTVKDYITDQDNQRKMTATLKDITSRGWIFAGAYYYSLAREGSNNTNSASPTLTVSVKSVNQKSLAKFRNNFRAAKDFVTASKDYGADRGEGGDENESGMSSGTQGPGLTVPERGDQAAGAISDVMGESDNALSDVGRGIDPEGDDGVDPLVQLQTAGAGMLLAAQILFVVFLSITLVLGIAGNITFFVLGTGMPNPVGPGAILVYFVLIPLIFGILGILISLGGTLAIYIPLIPFIVFTTGAIAWLLAVVETMVAGPLVALGILSPTAQGHELLGKAEHAIMLIFNVFLRPCLMIFGLVASMYLLRVVLSMVNEAFWSSVIQGVIGANSTTKAAGPLSFALFLMAYVSFLVVVVNKAFSAIHVIPSQVMAWIGGGHHAPGGAGGESEALGETKGGVGSAAGGARAAMGQTQGLAGSAKGKLRGTEKNASVSAKGKEGGNDQAE